MDLFRFEVRENGKVVDGRPIADPFVNTSIQVRGIKAAWQVLFGGLDLVVRVDADYETVERVCELDPDYLGAQGSDRRKTWNAKFDDALHHYAEGLPD